MDFIHVKEELISAFPPGTEQVIAWDDDPGALVEALAQTLTTACADPIDQLRLELSPATASERGIGDWERDLGLDVSSLALTGTLDQRRAQVLARLREQGPPTLELIRTVLAALHAYRDPDALYVAEVPRAALRALHTRTQSGANAFGGGVGQTFPFTIRDDPRVSPGGPQVDLTFQAPVDLAGLQVRLTGPDGYVVEQPQPIGRGTSTSVRLWWPRFAGRQILGTWLLTLPATSSPGIVTSWSLFVEGLGRDAKGGDGLGAAIFEWSPVLEATLFGYPFDLFPGDVWRAAIAAVQRLTYATRTAFVALWPTGILTPPLVPDAIVDDPACIVDACLAGAGV